MCRFYDPITEDDGECGDPNDMSEPNKTKYTMFHYYNIDGGINDDMGDDGGSGSSTPGSTASSTIDMAHLFDSSVSVNCASGTKDLGIQDGYHEGKKVKIRTCAIPNLSSTGGESDSTSSYFIRNSDGKAIVNSRVSGAVYNMVTSAKGDGVNLSAGSSFRSMAHQQYLWNKNPDPARVAPPGYSNHQMGVAIDFSDLPSSPGPVPGNSVWEWLSKNAGDFGYKNYPAEAWHWSPTGN